MILFYCLVSSNGMPLLIKHDDKLSLLPVFLDPADAKRYLEGVQKGWSPSDRCTVVELDGGVLTTIKKSAKALGIDIAVKVLDNH